MKIWIDADAAPNEVKDVVFRAGKRLAIEVVVVANRSVAIPAAYATVKVVVVAGRPDEADRHIVEASAIGDLVVTADIALASALVKKGVAAIDQRGDEYTDENVSDRLGVRNLLDDLRGASMRTSGPRPYDLRDKQGFAETFDRVVTRLTRRLKER